MTKAVTKKEKNELAAFEGETWGAEGMDNEDMIIPKLRLMQPMSELVTDGIATMGEFRDSLNSDVKLGGVDAPLEFIVFSSFKTWWIFKDGEYSETVSFGPDNAHWRGNWNIEENGVSINRSLLLNFYILTTKDIAEGVPFPKVITFKGTSSDAGKKLATFLKMLQAVKMPASASVFSLNAKKETNDKGTFFVFDVAKARRSTPEEVEMGKMWHQTVASSNKYVVDTEEEEVTTEPVIPADVPNFAPGADAPTVSV